MYKKRDKYRIISMICALVISGILTGCSDSSEAKLPETSVYSSSEIAEDVPEELIEVICVQDGYDARESKRLIVFADTLPQNLIICDDKNNQVMSIEVSPYGVVKEKKLGHAEFSTLKVPGTYKVYVDKDREKVLAEFEIDIDYFKKEIKELVLECFDTAGEYEAYVIAESYELYPNAYDDDWGISESGNGIPDVLDLLETYIKTNSKNCSPYYVATVEKYGHLIEEYDNAKSRKTAEIVKSISEQKEDSVDQNSIDEFWSDLAYLNSTSDVDVELAGGLMKKIIHDSERILNLYKEEYPFFYQGTENATVILENMVNLSVIDTILPAFEYYKVVNRQMNYLRGLNSEKCGVGMEEPKNIANMVFVYSHLATVEDSVNELYAQEN